MRPYPPLARFAAMLLMLAAVPVAAQVANEPPPAGDRLIRVDREKREVRVRCQALRVDMPLEFFCVLAGTADHETVLRTVAKPSAVHAALVGLGARPGSPVRFVPERKQWLAPHGAPVRIEVEWEQDGQTIRRRAGELIRNLKTGDPMPARPFVFSGSQIINGEYGADATGQLVSLVNFEFSTFDVPQVASNANETLEWEINRDAMPPEGAEVWMVLTPIGETMQSTTREATTRAAEAAQAPSEGVVIVVALTADGEVRVNNEPVALGEAGRAVRSRSPGAGSAVRLTAPRGAPIETLGRLLANLAEAELTDVTFVPPEEARAARHAKAGDATAPASGEGWISIRSDVAVHDGGREVSVEGKRQPLGQFIDAAQRQAAGDGARRQAGPSYRIAPAEGDVDVHPVDLAAVHAALFVLGYDVEVQAPGYGMGADRESGGRLAELRARWEREVLPQSASLRQAAETHFAVMEAYQREINRLLDEADRLRREMDDLQSRYTELTTPRPAEGVK